MPAATFKMDIHSRIWRIAFCMTVLGMLLKFLPVQTPGIVEKILHLDHLNIQKTTPVHASAHQNPSISWHPPKLSRLNDLKFAVNGSGVYNFVFNSSNVPGTAQYGIYNWCNMPHVRWQEYPRVEPGYELKYVEVIHRHHKRSPYAANMFPHQSFDSACGDHGPISYGDFVFSKRLDNNESCQLPQITLDGATDSFQHGKDLYDVYSTLLGYLPEDPHNDIFIRVTNNNITSHVAQKISEAYFGAQEAYEVHSQSEHVDSLEPSHKCKKAFDVMASYGVGSNDPNWTKHIDAAKNLFTRLDAVSGVAPDNCGFHESLDHYFDNLSARLCHQIPLPCAHDDPGDCISQEDADTVFRLGEYEYSYLYRDAPQSLETSVGRFGVYLAELTLNIRRAIHGKSTPKFRHNIGHDGSIALLLSILQVEKMVWPGMGAELIFELYQAGPHHSIRILWGGQILRSSNPSIVRADLIPAEVLLAYFDALVGPKAKKVIAFCNS